MRLDLLLLAVSLAASMPFEKTDNTIVVGVREVHVENEGLRAKRGTEMPRKKKFEIELKGETVTLDLTLNEFVDSNAPIYVVEDGELKKWHRKTSNEQFGFYQDRNMQASIMVRCREGLCRPIGSFIARGQRYHLSLDGKPIESNSLLSPVKEPSNMNISREGDMVFVTENASNADAENVTQVPTPHTLHNTLVQELNISQQDSRIKRAIPAGTDIVEIMVFADDAICNRFTALENGNKDAAIAIMGSYYALLVNEMDTLFQPFKNHSANKAGLDTRLFFSGIVTACDSSPAPWSGNGNTSGSDLGSLASWQHNQTAKGKIQYDVAMGISGRRKDGSLGIAYVGTICNSKYGALVVYEDKTSTYLLTTSVHELAHVLGASHDQKVGCPAFYLMSVNASVGTEATAKIQYEFTTCSVDKMQSKLSSLGSSRCTLQHNFDNKKYDDFRARAIGGEEFSLDFQCQLYFGPASYACSKNSSTMCYSGVYCQTSTGCDGRMKLVKEHTTCDKYKWCEKGQCVNMYTGGVETTDGCIIYARCQRKNKQLVGDACCQGSVTTDCCMLGERRSSCSMEIPCD